MKVPGGRRTSRSLANPIKPTRPSTGDAYLRSSIADVAGAARVSNATVSRVMNGTGGFSKATAARVFAAVKQLNYRPSFAGNALRSGRNSIVALMLTDPTHAYSGAVAASVEEALRRRGKTMILCNTNEDPARQDEAAAGNACPSGMRHRLAWRRSEPRPRSGAAIARARSFSWFAALRVDLWRRSSALMTGRQDAKSLNISWSAASADAC